LAAHATREIIRQITITTKLAFLISSSPFFFDQMQKRVTPLFLLFD